MALTAILSLAFLSAAGQSRITGKLFEFFDYGDKKEEVPVKGITIRIVAGRDTLRTVSTLSGLFEYKNVPSGTVRLMAEDKAYRAVDQTVELVPGNNILFVEMTRKPQSLQGVTVTAETPSVTFRKDTVVFNASAVNVLEGENALEILRQMPGVEIRRGKIRIHGKEVKRTYVNGVLIYGDNAMTPLNALLAQEVVNIKSYEELSVKDRRRKARHGRCRGDSPGRRFLCRIL